MNKNLLGRTNQEFPSRWLALAAPDGGFSQESPQELVQTARDSGLPIDFSSQPALWGGCMRGADEVVLVQQGTYQIERATSEDHATDLVQAHLIETLSAIGRDCLDFYFLRIRRTVEEYQVNGALAALEAARGEGHLRFLGLHATGHPLAALGLWQFHDAFEVLLLPDDEDARTTLEPLAKQRRVGVIGVGFGDPRLVTVRSSEEIRQVAG
jgi:hypothetical protein